MVDVSVLNLILITSSLGPIWARFTSFPAALLTTWLLNRTWSFRGREKPQLRSEVSGYLAIQILGLLINSGIYVILVSGFLGITFGATYSLFVGSGATA